MAWAPTYASRTASTGQWNVMASADDSRASETVSLMEGYASFLRAIREASALRSRPLSIQREVQDEPEAVLREETGAAPDDDVPTLIAGQITGSTRR